MTDTHGDAASREAYTREDESPDELFYSFPRRVVHIDDGAIAALGRLYTDVLPAGGRLLDLMSSWRSHLPATFKTCEVVGLGLNAEEMADNPQLASHVLHDVNRDPRLPFGPGEFDGAMCAVSIQYVIHPLRLFRTKAVAIWLDSTDQHHMMLVRSYFESAGGWKDATVEDRSPGGYGDPLYAVWARTASG
jgi:hypothetical protein